MNGKIKAPTIFRRKRFAQFSVGECIITAEQQKAIEVKEAIKQVLDDIEAEGIEIDSKELEQRIADITETETQEQTPHLPAMRRTAQGRQVRLLWN